MWILWSITAEGTLIVPKKLRGSIAELLLSVMIPQYSQWGKLPTSLAEYALNLSRLYQYVIGEPKRGLKKHLSKLGKKIQSTMYSEIVRGEIG